ncbi:MAG: zinc-dependent alcohol dehydrogenase family protein [Acidobacteriota bacterium]|nr:MAG: zinc-dependent alcohol dehydrogenase family protein [Acidobacteriota bacterium]
MRAMVLDRQGDRLHERELPLPEPSRHQARVRVRACGVCRTDLHVLDGDLTQPKLPLIPGHEIVGIVDALGEDAISLAPGARVGIPWLGSTCGLCGPCRRGRENLCDNAGFTGYTLDGGYAEFALVDARYAFPLPDAYDDVHAAPLLCAGLIGYRSLVMAGDAERLGLYGFGAAAHIVCQLATFQGREVYAFTKPGDTAAQEFARSLGACWAGDSDEQPPVRIDAAILYAPVGSLIPAALEALVKGGIVVCAGIHMSTIPAFAYRLLWEERQIRSVANLTRRDGEEFLQLAAEAAIETRVTRYPLERANDALSDLRDGRLEGAAVLLVHER